MERAACAGMPLDKFFPERGDSASGNEGIMACFGCPVRRECKQYKEETGSSDGIWAGEYSKRGQSA